MFRLFLIQSAFSLASSESSSRLHAPVTHAEPRFLPPGKPRVNRDTNAAEFSSGATRLNLTFAGSDEPGAADNEFSASCIVRGNGRRQGSLWRRLNTRWRDVVRVCAHRRGNTARASASSCIRRTPQAAEYCNHADVSRALQRVQPVYRGLPETRELAEHAGLFARVA